MEAIDVLKLIGTILGIVVTLGGFIWKASKQDSKIDSVKDDLEALKKKEDLKAAGRIKDAERLIRLETQVQHVEKTLLRKRVMSTVGLVKMI